VGSRSWRLERRSLWSSTCFGDGTNVTKFQEGPGRHRRRQRKGWWRVTPSRSMRIMEHIAKLAYTAALKAPGLARSLHSLTVSHRPARSFEKSAHSCCKAWMHVCAPDVLHATRLGCFRLASEWEPAGMLPASQATITGLAHTTHFRKSSPKHVGEPRTNSAK